MAQGIETQIGRVPTVAGEGVLDSSLKTRQLQSGLSQLSTSLKEFGKASDARRIQNDIITARTAFALNEEMPGSLAPEAELAYDGLVATRSTQQFFRLLADDSEVYANGLLTDDENYPDHNSKQAAFESFIEGAKGTFFEQAQFSPAQQESILQYVSDRSNTIKADFATLAAKDIKALKKNEAAKFVQENILDRQTRFNQLRKSNTVNATRGWTPDTHIKGSSAFSRDWHEDLKKKLSIANPHLKEDELDEIIIQQIGLLATDPDDPHPEYLEYFNESGKGGKPAINIIPSLAKNARALYTTARSAFINHHKAKNTLANKVQKDRENLAHINAQNYIIEEIGSLTGHRDLTKLTEKIREKFPHIAAPKLQSVINFANTLISADKKDGNSQLTTRMVLEATKGHLSLLDFEAGTRIGLLNQQQIVEVQKAITNYSVGEIHENQKNLITEVDSFTELLENAVASKVVIKFGKDTNGADKPYDFSSERMRFNSITQRPTGFSPKASSIMDAMINQFHDSAEIIIYDNKNTDPKDARRELSKLKYQFLREAGILNDGKETTIPTKKVKNSRDYGTSAAQLFDSQLAEDTSKETIAKTDSDIKVLTFKADVPDNYNPTVHVPPSVVFFPTHPDRIKAKEVKDEKDTTVPRDIPTDVPGSTKSVPVTKPLSIPQQRSEAVDKAFPEVSNERNELRKLQDTAEFQDDITPMKQVEDYLKKLENILGVKREDNKKETGITNIKQKRSRGLPKQIAVKPRSIKEEATLGSNIYNASPTAVERKEWAASYERNVIRFRENKLTKPEKRNADRMISVLNKAKNSFKDDLKYLNISHENFLERMIGVYGAETSFGRDKNFLKTGKSETGVRGDLQTTFETFTDVLSPKGNFGPMMAKAAGYDIKKLRSMDRKQLEKILYKPDFNYLAGAAIMLYKLQYKK